jgi:hypothetical protein
MNERDHVRHDQDEHEDSPNQPRRAIEGAPAAMPRIVKDWMLQSFRNNRHFSNSKKPAIFRRCSG